MTSSSRTAAAVFVFVTILLDMLALGMIIPVLPLLIESFQGGDTAAAARTVGVFGTAWAAVQIFASPVLGALSDRFGRRPVILLSNLGLGVDYILMAMAPSLGWLFAGRILAGLTSASVPTAFAYVSDVTPPEKRAKAFGLMGAAFGVGFIVGPALGGMLGSFGPRTPFWVASAFSLANAAYGFFVLPESLAPEHRTAFAWSRANPMGSLRLLQSKPGLIGFGAIHFLYNLAHLSLQSTFVLYANYRFGWDSVHVGWALAGVGACFALVQGGLVAPIVARFGERRALLTGLAFGAAGFLVYGLAPTGPWFLVGIPVMSIWGLYGPSVQALMTQRMGRAQQGSLQGALASIQMSTGLVGPALFTEAFARFISPDSRWHLPGAPYLLSSGLVLLALVLAIRIARPVASANV